MKCPETLADHREEHLESLHSSELMWCFSRDEQHLSLSHSVRLKRLKEEGAIVASFGAEPLRMGLSLAKVDVVTTNTTKLLDAFEKCPYFLNGFIVSGEYNLCLFFVGENTSTLEAIVDHHIRSMDEVQKAIFNVIVESFHLTDRGGC